MRRRSASATKALTSPTTSARALIQRTRERHGEIAQFFIDGGLGRAGLRRAQAQDYRTASITPPKALDEFGPGPAQLLAVHARQAVQLLRSLRSEADANLAAVFGAAHALHQASLFQAVHQADGAVMAEDEVAASWEMVGEPVFVEPSMASSNWCCCGSRPSARAASSLK